MITKVDESNLELLFEVVSSVDGPFNDLSFVRGKMRKYVDRKDRRAFIFVENGIALGYVACKFHEDNPIGNLRSRTDPLGHLAKIGVRKDARGRGIGSLLLEFGELWLKSVGFSGIWLDYIPTEVRKSFYREYEVLVEYTETGATHSRRIAVKKW